MNSVTKLILQFVENSGGVDRIRQVKSAITSVPDEERADLARRVTANDAGARQLLAAALLGFTIADAVCSMQEQIDGETPQ